MPPADPPRKRWNRSECLVLDSSGVLVQQKLELIHGDLIDRARKKRPHVATLSFLFAPLLRMFGSEYVNIAATIDVSPDDNPSNEPEPDLIVLGRPSREIKIGNPQPADLRLVIEISDSTLGFDLRVKAPLYARAGIVEYWVVDISGRRIIVHRDPREGAYGSVEAYNDQESVRPLASPNNAFRVSNAFPE